MKTPEPEPVEIRDEMIRLGQLLKLANLVEDGVQARDVVAEGYVSVNDATETQRGKQLHPGDTVTYAGRTVRITRG